MAHLAVNQHANIVKQVSAATLADIEGLDPETNGFCRGCDASDKKSSSTLLGTFANLKRHIFVGTHIPFTQWDKVADNVNGLKEISKAVKALSESQVTAFYDSQLKEGEVRRIMFDWKGNAAEMSEVKGVDPKEVDFAVKDEDSSRKALDDDQIFIFVCSHTKRDGRCGYCGPVIVDLLTKNLKEKRADGKISVYPCSHVSGHVYAGNVLVYGKNGGVVYGNFCPSDVEMLVDHLISKGHTTEVPAPFAEKVRGYLGNVPPPATTEAKSESGSNL